MEIMSPSSSSSSSAPLRGTIKMPHHLNYQEAKKEEEEDDDVS